MHVSSVKNFGRNNIHLIHKIRQSLEVRESLSEDPHPIKNLNISNIKYIFWIFLFQNEILNERIQSKQYTYIALNPSTVSTRRPLVHFASHLFFLLRVYTRYHTPTHSVSVFISYRFKLSCVYLSDCFESTYYDHKGQFRILGGFKTFNCIQQEGWPLDLL